jgi:hypothetical protein
VIEKETTRVMLAVLSYFKVTRQELVGHGRTQDIVLARHVALYLERVVGDRPFTEIARIYGGRDHTTVMAACNHMAARIQARDERYEEHVRVLRTQLDTLAAEKNNLLLMNCPTCGAPVIAELRRQIEELRAQLNSQQGVASGNVR